MNGAAGGALLLLTACSSEAVGLRLPGGGASAHVWAESEGLGEQRLMIAVQNSRGRVSRTLWVDWGPAHRVNLYLTSEGWLAALGGGGDAEMFEIPSGARPRWIPYDNRPRSDGRDWQYIGVIDQFEGKLKYFSPAQSTECLPMYGAGFSPYRKVHQAEHDC